MGYPGGKGKVFQHIINLIPPHNVFIETHLGSGSVIKNKKPTLENIGIDIDPRVISTWQENNSNNHIKLINDDALKFLNNYKFKGDELLYCDPPYPKQCRRKKYIYRYDYEESDHIQLLQTLIRLPCKIIISSYDNDLYNTFLSNWSKATFSSMTHTGLRM